MNRNDDGGPAFPPHAASTADEYMGMTLRDYFAAKAMASMIGTSAGPTCVGGLEGAEPHCAEAAYKMADAMLAARNQEPASTANPDALRALIAEFRKEAKEATDGYEADAFNACAEKLEQALAAPAEGASAEDYERELSAVMPEDFKDWHQNDKREWPAVAAAVIRNLREREAMAWEQAAPDEGDWAVAWQYRFNSVESGWSPWTFTTEAYFDEINRAIVLGACSQTRALYTRPATTAQVPEGWRVLNFTGSFKTRGERWEVYDPDGNGGAICDGDIIDPVLRDLLDALASAPAAPKGGGVDEAMVERALAAYLRRQEDGESLYGCVTAALTAALATGEQP